MITTNVLGNAALVFMVRIFGAIITFLSYVLLARWMGADMAGKYFFAFSVCMVAANFANLGIPEASLRFVGEWIARGAPGSVKSFLHWAHRLTVVAATCSAALVWTLSQTYGYEGSSTALVFAMFMLPFWSLVRLHSIVAQGYSWLMLMVLPNTVFRPIMFISLVSLWYYWNGSIQAHEAMFIHMILVFMVSIAIWLLLYRRIERFEQVEIYDYAGWLKTSLPLVFVSLSVNFYPEYNTVIIGMVLDSVEVAHFNGAFRVAFLIAFVLMALDTVSLPKASQHYALSELKEMENILRYTSWSKTIVSFLGVVTLVVSGEWVLGWFGPTFVDAHPVMVLLSISLFVRSMLGPGVEILSITGYQNICLLISITNLVLTGVLVSILAFLHGIFGAALGILVVTIATRLWAAILVRRKINIAPDLMSKRIAI